MDELKIVIENQKGSYKSFETEGYPLKGVMYPVDYGYVEGYVGEDGDELDVFVGTGTNFGYMTVWRLDVPKETKFFINLADEEVQKVLEAFQPVLLAHKLLTEQEFLEKIAPFKEG